MRLHPVFPRMRRVSSVQTTIVGQQIPPGVQIAMSAYATHRSESHWGPQANVFNPYRWLDKEKGATGGANSMYSYFPFLLGPKRCIGSSFAIAEMAIFVVGLVGNFEMRLEEDMEIQMMTTRVVGKPTIEPRIEMAFLDGWS